MSGWILSLICFQIQTDIFKNFKQGSQHHFLIYLWFFDKKEQVQQPGLTFLIQINYLKILCAYKFIADWRVDHICLSCKVIKMGYCAGAFFSYSLISKSHFCEHFEKCLKVTLNVLDVIFTQNCIKHHTKYGVCIKQNQNFIFPHIVVLCRLIPSLLDCFNRI